MSAPAETRFTHQVIWIVVEGLLSIGVWALLHFYVVADALSYVAAGGHAKAEGVLFLGVCALAWVIAHRVCDMARGFKEVFIDAR